MNFNLLVSGALYSSQAGYSALQFCKAAVESGHRITQVFFYQDGASQANRFSLPLDDEYEPVSQWVQFSEAHDVPLALCVSAGERRGVMSDEQANDNKLTHAIGSAHERFDIVGLTSFHDAALASDRTVMFK